MRGCLIVIAGAVLASTLTGCAREPTVADAARRCAEYGFRPRSPELLPCVEKLQAAERRTRPTPPICLDTPSRVLCLEDVRS